MTLEAARDHLATVLKQSSTRIMFAESCTAGLCSATMAQVDGISSYLCGSAVTYVPELKHRWLNVLSATIAQHTCESQQVVDEMALGALTLAAEADWSAAVVGHLASDLECQVFVAIAHRSRGKETAVCATANRPLEGADRNQRQREATEIVLWTLADAISETL